MKNKIGDNNNKAIPDAKIVQDEKLGFDLQKIGSLGAGQRTVLAGYAGC